jgi:hypothetical protein
MSRFDVLSECSSTSSSCSQCSSLTSVSLTSQPSKTCNSELISSATSSSTLLSGLRTYASLPPLFSDWLCTPGNARPADDVTLESITKSEWPTSPLDLEDLNYLASRPTRIVPNAAQPDLPPSQQLRLLETAYGQSEWASVKIKHHKKACIIHDTYTLLLRLVCFLELADLSHMVHPMLQQFFLTEKAVGIKKMRQMLEPCAWNVGYMVCDSLTLRHVQGADRPPVYPRFLAPFVKCYSVLPRNAPLDDRALAAVLAYYNARLREYQRGVALRKQRRAMRTCIGYMKALQVQAKASVQITHEEVESIMRLNIDKLPRIDGFCWLRGVRRASRRSCAINFGKYLSSNIALGLSYATGGLEAPIRFSRLRERVNISATGDRLGHFYIPREGFPDVDPSPYQLHFHRWIGGSRGAMSSALDTLSSTIHKDSVLDNYTGRVNASLQTSADVCPNYIAEPNFSLLKKYGLPVDPNAPGSHPHPALKAIEESMLHRTSFAVNSECTVAFMKRAKFNRLQAKNSRFTTLVNPTLTVRDTTRWQGVDRLPTITTPSLLLHDVGHYLTPAEVSLLFDRHPDVKRIFFTAILPEEALLGHPSWHPSLYTLTKLDEDMYAYVLSEDGESYEQPFSTLNWLKVNRIGRPDGASHGVEIVERCMSHKLFCVSRHVPPVLKKWYVADAPDDIILPDVDGRIYAHSRCRVPRDVFNDVLSHALSLSSLRRTSAMAKVRTKIPQHRDINMDTWMALTQVCYALSLDPAELEREARVNTYAEFVLKQCRRWFHGHDHLLPMLSAAGLAVSWGSLLLPIFGVRVPDWHLTNATVPGWLLGATGALVSQAAVVLASGRLPKGVVLTAQTLGLVLPHLAYLFPPMPLGSFSIPSWVGGITASLLMTATIALFDGPGPHYEVRDFIKRMPKREYVTWKLGSVYVRAAGSTYEWFGPELEYQEPPPYDAPPSGPPPYAPLYTPPLLPYEHQFSPMFEPNESLPNTRAEAKRRKYADHPDYTHSSHDNAPRAPDSVSVHSEESTVSVQSSPTSLRSSVSDPSTLEEFTCSPESAALVERVLRATSYVEVFALPLHFTEPQLKHEYRQMSLKIHPDRCDHPKATSAFQTMQEAYDRAMLLFRRAPSYHHDSPAASAHFSESPIGSDTTQSEGVPLEPLMNHFGLNADDVFEDPDFYTFRVIEGASYPYPRNDCLLQAFMDMTGVDKKVAWDTLCAHAPEEIMNDPAIDTGGLTDVHLTVLAYAYGIGVRILGEVPEGVPTVVGLRNPPRTLLECDYVNIYIEVGDHERMGHWRAGPKTTFRGGAPNVSQAAFDRPHRPLTGFEQYLARSTDWMGLPCISAWHSYTTDPVRAKVYARDLKNGSTGTLLRQEGKGDVPQDFTKRMDSMVDNHTPRRVLFATTLGAPGSSKSSGLVSALLAKWTMTQSLWKMAVPRKKLRDALTKKMKLGKLSWKIGTFEQNIFKTGTTLIVDEISQLPPGYVDFCLIKDSTIQSVVVIGDVTQGNFHEVHPDSGLNAMSSEAYHFKIPGAKYRLFSNSIPRAVSDATGLPTTSKERGFIKVAQLPDPAYPIVCAAEGEERIYASQGFESYTFGTVQGQRFEDRPVQISLSNAALTAVSRGHFVSAMCRSNRGVIFINASTQQGLRSASTDPFLAGILCAQNRFAYQDLFKDELRGLDTYTPPSCYMPVLTRKPTAAFPHTPVGTRTTFRGGFRVPEERAPDSLKALLSLGDEELPEHVDWSREVERGPPTAGFFENEDFLVASYGDVPSREEREHYLRGEQSRQFDDAPWYIRDGKPSQGLEQLFPRQKNDDFVTSSTAVEKRLRFAPEWVNMKRYSARSWLGPILFRGFCECTGLDPTALPEFDELLYAQCIHENEFTKLTKKTQQTLMNNADRSDPDWRHTFVRIFVKSQLKVKMETLGSPFKPGQTLASFQDSVILVTGPMTRYLVIVSDRLYRPGYYYHPGHSPLQLSSWCQREWRDVPLNSTNDYSAFDQSQTGEALALEITLMRAYRMPEHVINYYEEIKLSLSCQYGDLAVMRFTGEGPTLFFNSVFNAALVGVQYRLPRGTPVAVAGDDLAINGVYPESAAWPLIRKHLTIVAKPERVKTASFCSWLLTPHGAIKEPRVVLAKLLIARDRGEESTSAPSLCAEVAVGYHVGDHVYDHLDDLQLAAHFYLVRYFVTHCPIRFRLYLTTRSFFEVLQGALQHLPEERRSQIVQLGNTLGELWMLEAKPARVAAAVLHQIGVKRLRESLSFDHLFQRLFRF